MACDLWPVNRSRLPELPAEGSPGYQDALDEQNDAIAQAQEILWALTGRRYGVCRVRVRPCVSADHCMEIGHRAISSQYISSYTFLVWDGASWGTTSCGCRASCKLTGPTMTHLPGPVHPVDDDHPLTVRIGGIALDPSEWVLEGGVLYRRGKNWPYQDLSKPEGDARTWSVTYWRGTPPPRYARQHLATLAKEILALWKDGNCRLPSSARNVSRQGVSMELDPKAIIEAGFTGLQEIDRWIASVNPHHVMAPPTVI